MSLDLKKHQINKVDRLLNKVYENDTVTVKKEECSTVYFCVVMRHFENVSSSGFVRLEALGCAVANAVAVANLLVTSGVAEIKKIKMKEKFITYELENGELAEKPTVHFKYDLTRSPDFFENINGQNQQEYHRSRHTAPQ